MAKIVHYPSVFNLDEKKEFEYHGNIQQVLTYLGVEKHSLCVTINGRTPEECDLEYLVKEDDLIEIRKMVHGGSADQKSGLASIIQIAALVAINFIPGLGQAATIAILAGSAIVAGALNRRAQELRAGEASGSTDTEVDTATNAYSLDNVSNEARPLRPMPVVMGAHRMAPDVFANPLKSYFYNTDDPIDYGELAPTIFNNYVPGINNSNGAMSLNNSWATMPAGYITTGFPQYDIKISPYFWGYETGPLTYLENLQIIDSVKNIYLGKGSAPSRMNFYDISLGGTFLPLVIYHSDPSDPYVGRYNVFHFLARARERPASIGYAQIADLYSGTVTSDPATPGSGWRQVHFLNNLGSGMVAGTSVNYNLITSSLIKVGSLAGYYYPSSVAATDQSAAVMSDISAFLLGLNGGSYSHGGSSSFTIQAQYVTNGVTSVNDEGIECSTQVFNFGIGDLLVGERRIGALDAQIPSLQSDISIINKSTAPQWWIPFFSYPKLLVCATEVKIEERKQLINLDQTELPIDLNDQSARNWIYFNGGYGHDFLYFYISGQIYSTNTSTGFSSNSTIIECQYRYSNQTTWIPIDGLGFLVVQNDNTKRIDIYGQITPIGMSADIKIEVRIRKLTLDSNDNDNNNICRLYLDKLTSYKSFYFYDLIAGDFSINAPLNLEGLYISALVNDQGQTNKYSAYVQSKCWVYDFDTETWSWDFTRNPAFWFLYFAHGGFLNLPSDDTMTYPYSPTWGWQNYPGHPDNTQKMFGVGLTNDELDLEKILEWAEFCEDSELYLDLVLTDETNCSDVLERIANTGRGSVTYYKGLLSVVYENPLQIPTCMFNMGNIKAGSFSVDYSVADPVALVIGNFVNRENWESEFVEAAVPFADPENISRIEVNLEGVTDPVNAQRDINILAARQFFQRRTYSWDVDFEGLQAKRGDLVYLSHDSTQYGYSGRITSFVLNDIGNVVGIKSTSIVDPDLMWITIREPNGDMQTYSATLNGDVIGFNDPYPIEKASAYISPTKDNSLSDYPKSVPEDFIFIAGAKETPGKIVRISEIKSNSDMTFTITAVDEDPAMWSYEYQNLPSPPPVLDPESFDDAELVLKVINTKTTDLGGGLVKVNWESINTDFVMILNEATGLPIEASGAYTFSGGQVVLELIAGQKYTLIIRPFAIGTAYEYEDKKEFIWLK